MASITGKSIKLYPDKQYVVFRSTSGGPMIATPQKDANGNATGEYVYTPIASSGIVFYESTCFYIPKGWMYASTSGNSKCPLTKGTVVCIGAKKGPSYGSICCWNPHVDGYTVSGCGQTKHVPIGGSTTLCCDIECAKGKTLEVHSNGATCGTVIRRTSATCFEVSNIASNVSIGFSCRGGRGGGGGGDDPGPHDPTPPGPDDPPTDPYDDPPYPDPGPEPLPDPDPDPDPIDPDPEPEPEPEPEPNPLEAIIWKRTDQ